MKQQRHSRKETISVLLISNTGQSSRQFHISRAAIRLLSYALAIICIFVALLVLHFITSEKQQATLRTQIDEDKQLIAQLESEKESINAEKTKLTEENKAIKEQARAEAEAAAQAQAAREAEEANPYPGAPDGYPYSGSGGILISPYSPEHPFMSINTHSDGSIIAAADGRVVAVTSNEAYPLIVELEHENGYITRYSCCEEAQTQLEENAQVKAGDALFSITVDNTQFDYQILLENKPLDPLIIIEAKG